MKKKCPLIESYLIARDFERNMKRLNKLFKKQKTYKVRITEKQLGILEYCAFNGIDTIHDLAKLMYVN